MQFLASVPSACTTKVCQSRQLLLTSVQTADERSVAGIQLWPDLATDLPLGEIPSPEFKVTSNAVGKLHFICAYTKQTQAGFKHLIVILF
jgi:hypothetical protein